MWSGVRRGLSLGWSYEAETLLVKRGRITAPTEFRSGLSREWRAAGTSLTEHGVHLRRTRAGCWGTNKYRSTRSCGLCCQRCGWSGAKRTIYDQNANGGPV